MKLALSGILTFVVGMNFCTQSGHFESTSTVYVNDSRAIPQPSPNEWTEAKLEYVKKGFERAKSVVVASDDITDVCFSDGVLGWLIVDGEARSSLFGTHDGGKTWAKTALPNPDNLKYLKVIFANSKNGWLIARPRTSGDSLFTETHILGTSDGGISWRSLQSFPSINVANIIFDENGRGWLVGSKPASLGKYGETGIILTSSDFGNTWTDVTPKSFAATQWADIQSNKSSATALSNAGVVLSTSSGGKSWDLFQSLSVERTGLAQISSGNYYKLAVSDNSGIVVLNGRNSQEGTNTDIQSFDENGETKFRVHFPGIFVTDIKYTSTGELLLCGTKIDLDQNKNEVVRSGIIIKKDGSDWRVIYEYKGPCPKGCIFNKIAIGSKMVFAARGGSLLFFPRHDLELLGTSGRYKVA